MLHYFNSIKVRLELGKLCAQMSVAVFQFHKGAIRTSFPIALVFVFIDFNSIKVRLERTVPTSSKQCQTFQFHKGAIRTEGS